jgi:hypothetical protein
MKATFVAMEVLLFHDVIGPLSFVPSSPAVESFPGSCKLTDKGQMTKNE